MDRFGRKDLNSRPLRVESLESRALLAGHSAGASFALASEVLQQHLPASVAAHIAGPIAGAIAAVTHDTVLTAHLTDSSATSSTAGTAVFHTGALRGQTNSQLAVEIVHALPNTSYDVAVGTTTLGTFKTNSHGAGHLVLFSNPRGSLMGLPPGFTVADGDMLAVTAEAATGDELSGEFAAPTPPVVTNLKATLSDSQGGSGKGVALYQSISKNGTTHANLEIVVTGGPKNASLDVFLNGRATSIGAVKTDAHGRGFLELSDPTLAISDGDVIAVGTLGGTFSAIGKR